MKGIIFTLDAVFSMIIAMASLTVLLYFFYAPQTTATISYSEVSTTLQLLLSTSPANVSLTNRVVSMIAAQTNVSNEVWDMGYRDNKNNAGNVHGPAYPIVSFIFNASQPIMSKVVADYGKIYFATSNTVYAVNATTGALVWKLHSPTNVIGNLTIAPGLLIYANTTNLDAIDPNTNSLIWTTSIIGVFNHEISNPIIYNGRIYVGADQSKASNVIAFSTANGTEVWTYYIPNIIGSMAIVDGSLLVKGNSNTITLLGDIGSSSNVLWTQTYLTPVTNVASFNSTIVAGIGGPADFLYVNGILKASVASTVNSVSILNNTVAIQTPNGVLAYSTNANPIYTISSSCSGCGTAMLNSTPVISSSLIYSLWSGNYLLAQNASGALAWTTHIPYNGLKPYMTLAYGKLYLSAGTLLLAYGSCSTPYQKSLLSMAAALYLNGYGGCADALIDYVNPMTNYSIFLNGTFAPSTDIASFNSLNKSNIIVPNSPLNNVLLNNSFTWSFWFNASSWGPTNGLITDTCYTSGCPEFLETVNAQKAKLIEFTVNGAGTNSPVYASISAKTWTYIAGTFSNIVGNTTLYVNGVKVNSLSYNMIRTILSQNIIIGGYLSGNYFNGSIADFQIYNISLTPTQVAKLYYSGIQGPPLQNAGLVAWFPLDGDANNYATSGITGYPINIIYSNGNYLPLGYTSSYKTSESATVLPIVNYSTGSIKPYKVSVVAWR